VRPYLLIDVDFVLNPDFSAVWDGGEGDALRAAGWVVLQGFAMNARPVWLNLRHGTALLRVAYETGAELAWATNWHHYANQVVAPILGLPQLPLATSPPRPKEQAVIEWTAGRPFVWLDDEAHVHAAIDAAPNGASVKIDPATGLTDANLEEAMKRLERAA
jgi:HAD domain in Swiss Army Knife RNA repair proteins